MCDSFLESSLNSPVAYDCCTYKSYIFFFKQRVFPRKWIHVTKSTKSIRLQSQ